MCEANGQAVGAMLAAVYDDRPPAFRWKRRRRRRKPAHPATPEPVRTSQGHTLNADSPVTDREPKKAR